jgi:hypothetical protein
MEDDNNNAGAEATETRKSFDELLQDKDYQSAFDKKIAQSLQTAKTKWKEELESEKAEAERLAKLSSEERFKEEIKKSKEKETEALSKLNAYELKEQAIKDNKDIPLELINLIDFSICNTAELVKSKIDTIKEVYKKSVEIGINDVLKEKTPKTVINNEIETKSRTRTSY